MKGNKSNLSSFLILVPEFSYAYYLLKSFLTFFQDFIFILLELIASKYKSNNENLFIELNKLQNLEISSKFYEFDNKFIVETKYYTASIQLIIILSQFLLEQKSKYETYKQLFKDCNINEPDALGFCIKIDKEQNLIGYPEFKSLAEPIFNEYDPGLQFLFINRKSTDKMEIQYEVNTNKFKIIQKDKSQVYIEFIYDDLEKEIEEQKLDEEKKKCAFEERYGVDRLAEIIDCNLWKGLKKKKMKGEQKIEEIKKFEEEKKKEIEEKNKDLTEQEKEIKQEIEMEQFSELLSNMKNLRSIGKTLSDEERRKQAADLITQMANLIGVDEDSDQDEQAQTHNNDQKKEN